RGGFDVVAEFLTGYRVGAQSMSQDVEQMLRSDDLVRQEARSSYPQFAAGIDEGRKFYIEWLISEGIEDLSVARLRRLLAYRRKSAGRWLESVSCHFKAGGLVASRLVRRSVKDPPGQPFLAAGAGTA